MGLHRSQHLVPDGLCVRQVGRRFRSLALERAVAPDARAPGRVAGRPDRPAVAAPQVFEGLVPKGLLGLGRVERGRVRRLSRRDQACDARARVNLQVETST